VRTGDGLGPVSWPLLRQGFQEMGKRYPDSFEVKSAFCFFAVRFKDLPETQRLLREIGPRMQTSVWRDRNQFAEAHRWANFDNGEEGPAALRWLMRLRAP
jgi:hypothetical protein